MKQLRNSVVKWLVVSLFCLLIGFLLGKFKQNILAHQVSALSLDMQTLQTENEGLETDFSNLQIRSVAMQQSISSLLDNNKQLQDELSLVNNKLFFYERVIAPELDVVGVKIYSFEVVKNRHTQQWDYQLVLMQSQKERHLLIGTFAITLSVFEGSKLRQIPLNELTEQQADSFKFKYFQTVQGSFSLPVEMTVDEVFIQLKVTGNRWYKAQNLEERYDWRVLTAQDVDNLSEFDSRETNDSSEINDSNDSNISSASSGH